MTTTPDAVEPGQVWRDRDQRTKGTGEFVVLAVVHHQAGLTIQSGLDDALNARVLRSAATAARRLALTPSADGGIAVIHRRATDRVTILRVDRFRGGARGYEYVGRGK